MVVFIDQQAQPSCRESSSSSSSSSFTVDPEYARITEIVPHLYICGVSSLTRENMDRYEINFIVNATTEVPNLRSLGPIARSKLWLNDTPDTDIYQYFDFVADQIAATIAGGGNVLVHCVAGVSRSASICLAYLTKYRCKTLRDAYRLMAAKRPLVRPNIGFWRQLIDYERVVKEALPSVRIVPQSIGTDDEPTPDIYLDSSIAEPRLMIDEKRNRRNSNARLKFIPVLEPVPEQIEIAASC